MTNTRKAIPYLVLAFLVLFCFRDYLTGEKVFAFGDLAYLSYPIRSFDSSALSNGILPTWNPYNYFGFAQYAEGQNGLFYPLTRLFYFLLPNILAFNYLIIATIYAAASFQFLWLHSRGLSNSASFLGAIAFGYSGFFMARVIHANLIMAACWLPLAFYAVDKISGDKPRRGMLILSLTIACMLLAGYPIYALYSISAVLAYALITKRFQTSTRTFWAVLLGGALAAIQVLPSLEYGQLSARILDPAFPVFPEGSLTFEYLWTLLMPKYFGVPDSYTGPWNPTGFWELNIYVGALTLVFMLLGILFSKHRLKTFAVFLGLSSLLISMGNYGQIFELFKDVPVINSLIVLGSGYREGSCSCLFSPFPL